MILDRRLFAYRPDLADERLRDLVAAERYVAGYLMEIGVPVAPLRPSPSNDVGIDTEVLFGETVRVFDVHDGLAFVQCEKDGYVGYLPSDVLRQPTNATHVIVVPRTFVYREPELKTYPIHALSMGSRVNFVGEAEVRGTKYLVTDEGHGVIACHCIEAGKSMSGDRVDIALQFLHTPYLWGGRSGFGIDCSGLVQLAMSMVGETAPRDTDMQFKSLGDDVDRASLKRGDLVFWKGHVGLMEDEQTLLHANGHTMSVARENLDEAIERIGWLYNQPTGFRRLPSA